MEKKGLLVIDEILELMKNGEWHRLAELADRSGLGERKVGLLTQLLCEFDFLECDKQAQRVKLSPGLLTFLRRVELLERAEAGGEKKAAMRGVSAFLRVVASSFVSG